MKKSPKKYNTDGLAGCVQRRIPHHSKDTVVAIFKVDQSTFPAVQALADKGFPWGLTCEGHGHAWGIKALSDAKDAAVHPKDWCHACRLGERCTFPWLEESSGTKTGAEA